MAEIKFQTLKKVDKWRGSIYRKDKNTKEIILVCEDDKENRLVLQVTTQQYGSDINDVHFDFSSGYKSNSINLKDLLSHLRLL